MWYFASAHPAQIATVVHDFLAVRNRLCLSTSRTNCNAAYALRLSGTRSLPQHIPRKLQLSALHQFHTRSQFASAHPAQIATDWVDLWVDFFPLCLSTSRANCNLSYQCALKSVLPLPQHIPRKLQRTMTLYVCYYKNLCLSTSRANCNTGACLIREEVDTLPQHIPRKLQLVIGESTSQIKFFASAHPAQIATVFPTVCVGVTCLCLSTSRANCNMPRSCGAAR